MQRFVISMRGVRRAGCAVGLLLIAVQRWRNLLSECSFVRRVGLRPVVAAHKPQLDLVPGRRPHVLLHGSSVFAEMKG
jgi:hypothetical protein